MKNSSAASQTRTIDLQNSVNNAILNNWVKPGIKKRRAGTFIEPVYKNYDKAKTKLVSLMKVDRNY